MAEDIQQKPYTNQVKAAIQGFVNVWIKFEAMINNELAKTQSHHEGKHPISESRPSTDYGLFYRVSSNIYGKSSLTMGELSSALSVPLSTATRIVDWMVANGYVQRLSAPEDRRVVRVALTDSGRELHKTIESYTTDRVQQALSGLTDGEQTALFIIIRKMVAALKDVAE
jgi:DNA-binding MarR family transcriptional regulator